jgi:hypothetical protein
MVCIICKKTENELKNENALEIDNINKVLTILNDKINKSTREKTSEIENNKDYKNCNGENGKYCLNCDFIESVDDKEYYWCKTYKKTFSFSLDFNIKQWNKEIEALKFRCKEIENINLEIINIPENIDDKYNKIMSTYLPEYSKQERHSSVNICSRCNTLLDKIIENKIYDLKDYIIDMVNDETEDDEE